MPSPWEKALINVQDEKCTAIAPVIISASRRTDIPAFYAKSFFNDWKRGFFTVANPFNANQTAFVSILNCRVVIFWTKDPNPILPYLSILDDAGIGYYFLFTLNDYQLEGFERGLRPFHERIKTFLELSRRIDPDRILWRFDPVILTGQNSSALLQRIESTGQILKNATKTCIFSFLDIGMYPTVRRRMEHQKVSIPPVTLNAKIVFAEQLRDLCLKFGITPATCAEEISLTVAGVKKNKCVDDLLLRKLYPEDGQLMKFLDSRDGHLKDDHQRKECGCIWSKDIGQYDTCGYQCIYCYARKRKSTCIPNCS